MGEKPIIRIAVPGQTAEDFMQAAAKQFRGDFFVAIDQPVGKHVRIEAPFLSGDVGVRGDAIAMPAVRNGRKGLVIRLVKLDADSLGIPIPEAKEPVAQLDDDDEPNEFELGQATVASNVSAAVAQSIRATSQPIKPIKPSELDADTREAVEEFGDMSTRASEITDEMAKKLTERSVPPATTVTPKAAHIVRRTTPESGIPVKPAPVLRKIEDEPEKPEAVERDSRRHTRPTAQLSALVPDEVELPATDDQPVKVPAPEPAELVEPAVDDVPEEVAPAPAPASKGATAVLIVLILLTLAAAAYVLLTSL